MQKKKEGGKNLFMALYMVYGSASQIPDSGPHPDPKGIQSGPASISYFKSTNYISYFDKCMLNL